MLHHKAVNKNLYKCKISIMLSSFIPFIALLKYVIFINFDFILNVNHGLVETSTDMCVSVCACMHVCVCVNEHRTSN